MSHAEGHDDDVFREFFDHTPDAAWLVNPASGTVVDCNSAALALLAAGREEVLGRRLQEWSGLDGQDALGMPILNQVMQSLPSPGNGRSLWRVRRRDGTELDLDVTVTQVCRWGTPLSMLLAREMPPLVTAKTIPARKEAAPEDPKGEGKTELVRANAQLKREIAERRRRARIQQAVFEISEATHAADDLASLYGRIHEIVQTLMSARNFYIALLDPATRQISFPYRVDLAGATPPTIPLGTGLTSCVLKTGKPLLVGPEQNRHRRKHEQAVTFEGMQWLSHVESGRSAQVWLGVPLLEQGRAIGVMAVQDYENARAYSDEDAQLLGFVAAQTTVAIARKRDEEESRRRVEQEQRFRNGLLDLAQLGDMAAGDALGRICAVAADVLKVDRVGYWTLAPDGSSISCRKLHQTPGAGTGDEKGLRLEAAAAPQYFAELAQRKPIVAHDALHHPATSNLGQGYLRKVGISSLLDVPVWLRGDVAGVLCHEHLGPARVWSAAEIDFATAVATRISVALEESARKQSERLLRESEARFGTAFHASPVLTTMTRVATSKFIEVNECFASWIGLEREQIIGRDALELGLWVSLDERKDFLSRLLSSGNIRELECRFKNRHGAVHTMLLCAEIIEINLEPHMLVFAMDITRQKLAEGELLRTLARERELGQLRSNLVSMVSHEFRTPLGIIQSSAEILDEYFDRLSGEERREHLLSIRGKTQRMAAMMEEVLLIGRFEAGKVGFKPVGLELPTLLRRLVEEVEAATDQRCPVLLELSGISGWAMADSLLVQHILTNLLTNAIKYSRAGTVVRLRASRESAWAVFQVEDHGIGIPKEDLPWLFDAFYRGRNVGDTPGTGLGLVIAKRCVDLHGGRIECVSRVEAGTTMTVSLPLFETELD